MGVANGEFWGFWDPQSNPTEKLLRIKRVCTMHALYIRLIELNNLHNIVHRTPQSKILATPMGNR